MAVIIDHVTVAGRSLPALQQAFAAVGLPAAYGGPHANGATHMALVSLPDGSYIELISVVEAGIRAPHWHRQIERDGGPCAWAVCTADLESDAARLRAAGILVRGPFRSSRRRPDGIRLEWDLALPGEQDPGAMLPFLIQDHTPRALRVTPPGEPGEGMSERVRAAHLTGVAGVVLGVGALNAAVALFRLAYGWPAPSIREDHALDASLAVFAGTPVVLAAPGTNTSWLAGRLAAFGEGPCAFLLGARDLAAARHALPLGGPVPWLDRSMAWLAGERLGHIRIGIID